MTPPIPIVALDLPNLALARDLVAKLGESCAFYKVGSQLFTAVGPDAIAAVKDAGKEVFLDLKFHDIPNTVAGAVRSAVAQGVRLVTVHASGGEMMLRSAVAAAGDPERCGILAVTVLTSLDAPDVAEAWGRREPLRVEDEVLRLADLAQRTGCHGVVCSGREAGPVRARFGDALAVLIPGVRPAGGDAQDQARVATPELAAASGARYVVLGRAVTAATSPGEALREIVGTLRANAA